MVACIKGRCYRQAFQGVELMQSHIKTAACTQENNTSRLAGLPEIPCHCVRRTNRFLKQMEHKEKIIPDQHYGQCIIPYPLSTSVGMHCMADMQNADMQA